MVRRTAHSQLSMRVESTCPSLRAGPCLYCERPFEYRGVSVTEPGQQQPTFGQKAKMGLQVAGALARNPKNLVALVKYKLSERKSAR